MSAPKGSPGPWRAVRVDDKWSVRDGEGLVVCEVVVSRPGYSHPIDRADALLIAAAPDLFAALEQAEKLLFVEAQRATATRSTVAVHHEIVAALKKARGES